MFQNLPMQTQDPLLALIGLFGQDTRLTKLDLGVGMFRDDDGHTPVMRAVKAAEQTLLHCQSSKGYLGPEGDLQFVELLSSLILGDTAMLGGRLIGVQTPGGGGALRLGADLLAAAKPKARIWVGSPTWPNHQPILAAARLDIATFPYFQPATQTLLFDDMMRMLAQANAGDVVLLQGCCHNPTGVDLDEPQWNALADLLAARRLVPILDFAYQGLGCGLDADAYGVRRVLSRVEEALIAYSCDKNFGLYRDRTGALFALGHSPETAGIIRDTMAALARVNWSMPPDHGAAVVRIILESHELTRSWRQELGDMQQRIVSVRRGLAKADDRLAFLLGQHGMFSQLQISPDAVVRLRKAHGIYMPGTGRANFAGLRLQDIPAFLHGLQAVGAMPERSSHNRVGAMVA